MGLTKKQILWTDTDLSIKWKDIGVESKGIKYSYEVLEGTDT
jgi:hypothetical protein